METLTIYNYHKDTKEFLSESLAVPNPMEEGFIIPANATTKPVPEAQEGFAYVFNTEYNVWQQKADHRGTIVYSTINGQAEIVDYLGDYLDDYTLIAPQTGQIWQNDQWIYTRAAKVEALKAARDQAAVAYNFQGVTIKLGDGQRADLTALLLAYTLNQLPQDFILNWSENGFDDTENATLQIDLTTLPAFCFGALNQRNTAFNVYATVLPNVESYETPEEAAAVYNSQL